MTKQSIDKTRARMLVAALESTRAASTALIEFLEKGIIADADSKAIDDLVAQLGGGDSHLIDVLDDALDTLKNERNDYVVNAGLEQGEAVYKIK
jgi:hypothetical protein